MFENFHDTFHDNDDILFYDEDFSKVIVFAKEIGILGVDVDETNLDDDMAYSIHSHISYVLEVNSKRLLGKKMRNRSYAEEIKWGDFFSFLTKIFHNA